MEDPDEGDSGSFDATPTVQPVLLQSADIQNDEVGEPEDQYILLSSTHPDLQENQIQTSQTTVHAPPTYEVLSQATGSELALHMDIEDNPASEQYVYVPGVATKVYISKQLLLNEIASKLGLIIHSLLVKVEETDQYRASLTMDLPRAGIRV
ncbi:uncharacterized protein LOC127785331 [Oryza glaberrima]|uniref:uncharacterized protein LOC127785331 n=1 Tax=Oryza glaberrima TaxID=4538 RepID=UPI00224C56D5|nr:uncharacterized protein LOC127785331 [Oryza glaberrima]